MYAGRIVESAPVRELFHYPRHPYTQALLKSLPQPGKHHGQRLPTIKGIVPSLFNLPAGCRFHNRCERRKERCEVEKPDLTDNGTRSKFRCHFPIEPGLEKPRD